MSGVVSGGWHFVWAAYLVTAVILGAYAIRTICLGAQASRNPTLTGEHSER